MTALSNWSASFLDMPVLIMHILCQGLSQSLDTNRDVPLAIVFLHWQHVTFLCFRGFGQQVPTKFLSHCPSWPNSVQSQWTHFLQLLQLTGLCLFVMHSLRSKQFQLGPGLLLMSTADSNTIQVMPGERLLRIATGSLSRASENPSQTSPVVTRLCLCPLVFWIAAMRPNTSIQNNR